MKLDVSLPIEIWSNEALCVMSMLVYDEDEDGSSELLGRAWTIMQPEKILYKIKVDGEETGELMEIMFKRPKWWNVKYDATGETAGKVLMGYALIKKEESAKVADEDISELSTMEREIYMYCIGVRDIETPIVTEKYASMEIKLGGTTKK